MKKNGTETKAKAADNSVRAEQKQTKTRKSGNSESNRKREVKRKDKEITPKIYVGLTIAGVRIMPILISLVMIVNTILQSCFNVNSLSLSMFFGVSYTSLIALWILSKTYRFCVYHRLFIYHSAIYNTVVWYDSTDPICLANFDTVVFLLCMSFVFFAGALWAHIKYGDREAPKK